MTRLWRGPLLVVALLSLTWGVWLGLLRLGWNLPLPWPEQLILHGPLMIGGFLGTLVSLERAIEAGKRWVYAAPVCSAAGALLLVLGPPGPGGPALLAVGSAVVTIASVSELRRRPSLARLTMLAGAAAWTFGNVSWLGGMAIYRVVFWWAAFPVLTIAGERLELSHVREPTILLPDLARFTSVCLWAGYAWLGAAGVLLLTTDATSPGTAYDAVLHAIFVGLVVSMIFGHAPMILSTVFGTLPPYHPVFYVHLVVLHLSLLMRVVGDLVESLGRYRAWGGLFNAAALALFLVTTGGSAVLMRARRSL